MRRHQAAEAPPGAAGAHFCSDLEVEQTGFEPSVPLGSGSAGKVERRRLDKWIPLAGDQGFESRLLRQPVRLTREFRDLQEGFGSGGTAGRHLADRAVEIDVRNQPGVAVAAHHLIELTGSPLALMISLRTMTPAAATAVAWRQLSIIGNAIILIAVADLASDFIGVAGLTGLGVGAFLLALKLDACGADRNPVDPKDSKVQRIGYTDRLWTWAGAARSRVNLAARQGGRRGGGAHASPLAPVLVRFPHSLDEAAI